MFLTWTEHMKSAVLAVSRVGQLNQELLYHLYQQTTANHQYLWNAAYRYRIPVSHQLSVLLPVKMVLWQCWLSDSKGIWSAERPFQFRSNVVICTFSPTTWSNSRTEDHSHVLQMFKQLQFKQVCPSSKYLDINVHWPCRLLLPGEAYSLWATPLLT